MHKPIFALALTYLLLPIAANSATTITPVQIYDGDSFKVDIAGWPDVIGKQINIRLKGADAPSIGGKCKVESELALQASDFAWQFMIQAKELTLVDVERDHYFRLLARVEADGKDLSTALIEAGLAKPYDGGPIANWCTQPEAEPATVNLGIQT